MTFVWTLFRKIFNIFLKFVVEKRLSTTAPFQNEVGYQTEALSIQDGRTDGVTKIATWLLFLKMSSQRTVLLAKYAGWMQQAFLSCLERRLSRGTHFWASKAFKKWKAYSLEATGKPLEAVRKTWLNCSKRLSICDKVCIATLSYLCYTSNT